MSDDLMRWNSVTGCWEGLTGDGQWIVQVEGGEMWKVRHDGQPVSFWEHADEWLKVQEHASVYVRYTHVPQEPSAAGWDALAPLELDEDEAAELDDILEHPRAYPTVPVRGLPRGDRSRLRKSAGGGE